jgi:hypothetical protein
MGVEGRGEGGALAVRLRTFCSFLTSSCGWCCRWCLSATAACNGAELALFNSCPTQVAQLLGAVAWLTALLWRLPRLALVLVLAVVVPAN